MQAPVILIIGAGPNIGAAIAKKFSENGYKVALAARSLSAGLQSDGTLHVKADLSTPKNVSQIFHSVRENLGIPNIVVYNGTSLFPPNNCLSSRLRKPGAHRLTTPEDDPFSASLDTLIESRNVGLDSAYVAAQEGLKGFKELPDSVPTAFIYTGNALNQIAIPGVLPFALPKVSAAMVIEYGANAYGHKGYR